MANDAVCVFCGEPLGMFHSAIPCADIPQPCCKSCAKELKGLNEDELCRRALKLGHAREPQALTDRIELITNAESHRPTCLRCGGRLKYLEVQFLDNTPSADGIFDTGLEVLPAYCENCGQYAFFHPSCLEKDPHLSYLLHKDTGE